MVGFSTLSYPTGMVAFFFGLPSALKPSVLRWIPQYMNLSPKSSLKSSASALIGGSTGFLYLIIIVFFFFGITSI
jgi:hypothetical protein